MTFTNISLRLRPGKKRKKNKRKTTERIRELTISLKFQITFMKTLSHDRV